jgi:hypothetical protein
MSQTRNLKAAKLAIGRELVRAGYALHPDNEQWSADMASIFAVLADGRSVQRERSGTWVILRDPDDAV